MLFSSNFSLFPFYEFHFSVKLPVLFIYWFHYFISLSSVVFCSSLSFLRTAFSFIFIFLNQANHQSPFLWGQFLGNYFVPLVVSCFFDFLCSLKSCVAVLIFEKAITSSNLCWLDWENYLLLALLGILRLSKNISIDIPTPLVLFALVAEFLILYAFSKTCKVMLGADSLPLAFPRIFLNAQICVLPSNPSELS